MGISTFNKNVKIVFALFLASIALSGCTRSCSKSCALNLSHDAYVLKYKRPKCNDDSNVPSLELPLDYTVRCNSCEDGTFGTERALMKAKYPSFSKPDDLEPEVNKGEILIDISSNCGGKYSLNLENYPQHQFTAYQEIVAKNALSKGQDGLNRYADIEKVAGNLFVQKFINQRKDGADYYFYKDEQGNIVSLFSCSEDNYCGAIYTKPIYQGKFAYRFRSNKISPHNFPKIETEISDFLYNLENYKPAPKTKPTYN